MSVLLFDVFTVITAVPFVTPVTSPFSSTIATPGLLLIHVNSVPLFANSGLIVAVSCKVLFSVPKSIISFVLSNSTLNTFMVFTSTTSTLHIAVLLTPSCSIVATICVVPNSFATTLTFVFVVSSCSITATLVFDDNHVISPSIFVIAVISSVEPSSNDGIEFGCNLKT